MWTRWTVLIPIYLFIYLFICFIFVYFMGVERMGIAVARVQKSLDSTGLQAMINYFGSNVSAVRLIPSSIHALETIF